MKCEKIKSLYSLLIFLILGIISMISLIHIHLLITTKFKLKKEKKDQRRH